MIDVQRSINHLNGIQEVVGSNPISSTSEIKGLAVEADPFSSIPAPLPQQLPAAFLKLFSRLKSVIAKRRNRVSPMEFFHAAPYYVIKRT